MAAQDARGERMEGAEPHALGDRPDHGADALLHLARRLVGEGDREDLRGEGAARGDQMGKSRGQHARLARSARRRAVEPLEHQIGRQGLGQVHRSRVGYTAAPAAATRSAGRDFREAAGGRPMPARPRQPAGRRPMLLLRRFILAACAAFAIAVPSAAIAQTPAEQRLQSIVKLRIFVPPDARTADSLGRERSGSGVLIDQAGLILTIGYLMVEAESAEATLSNGRTLAAQIVGYDHETGFGLLRTLEPPRVPAAPLGRSASLKERDPVLIAAFGGAEGAQPGIVVSRRTFAGNWEYLLDDAIFTTPPHPAWSGAGLFDAEGRLVGIGSLIVGDAGGNRVSLPGNMFVPIDRLPPILADMIADGSPQGPRRPWLGLTTEELRGRLFVSRVTSDGPAARAGVQPGDMIVGVGGETPSDLVDFYRKVWKAGDAGVDVPLTVFNGSQMRQVTIKSVDRHSHLKLKRSY
jgi:serine protease Do